MTKLETAINIIKQNGDCRSLSCAECLLQKVRCRGGSHRRGGDMKAALPAEENLKLIKEKLLENYSKEEIAEALL